MANHNLDLPYMVRLRRGGFSVKSIAVRMGATIEAVEAAFRQIDALAESCTASGIIELLRTHEMACLQFQELGKTMGRVGFALGNQMRPEEVKELLEQSKKQADPVTFVLSRCIMLRPFIPDQIDQEMAEYVSAYHQHEAVAASTAEGSDKN